MPWESSFAYSPDEALLLLRSSCRAANSTTGLNTLRRTLVANSNFQVSNKLRQKQWLLIKDDAYFFDWSTFDKNFREDRRTQAALKLVAAPPVQMTKKPFEFMVMDSEIREPLLQRKCNLCHDGASVERKSDKEGLTYLSLYAAPAEMVVQLKT
jgi:uncharacterized Fe-S radical SAM superfamily protein PflX